MARKLYAHLDMKGCPPFTRPFHVGKPEEVQFGTMKEDFLKHFMAACPDAGQLQYEQCCFWNQDSCPIPDRCPIALFAWEHNDFFLRPLPSGNDSAGALLASQKQRGELSYYYAHNRGPQQQTLISRPPGSAAPPPPSSSLPRREPMRAPAHGAAAAAAGGKPFNQKQSPFGTDINSYESITSYTWEDDQGGDLVKVLVPLDGVGKLEPSAVRSNFGLRCFELLVDGYMGKNLRFACNKTHGEMKPEECKHVVRANRVNLVLKKAKEKDIWFDLFKKRAIGDDDDP